MDVDVLGAMNAMQDAVVLANCLYDLKDLSPESLTTAFEDYKSQRYKEAKKQVANSKLNARVSSGQVQCNIQDGTPVQYFLYWLMVAYVFDSFQFLRFPCSPENLFTYRPLLKRLSATWSLTLSRHR